MIDMAKKRIRKPTITQEILSSAAKHLQKYQHDLTRKQYLRDVKRYVKFCREHFDSRTFDDCKGHIQDYCDYLKKKGYTASTIHTYLSPICSLFEVDLSKIEKPVRHVANYQKGRNTPMIDAKNDISNPDWGYIVDFERKTGIRRDELKRLTGKDFQYDESGRACVLVRRGKGGKRQMQRILEKDISFIRSYFTSVAPDERIFNEKYFQNNLNFHHLRAECAREYYYEQLRRIRENPNYRAQLEKEIKARWYATNKKKNGKPKPFRNEELNGIYVLRGKNRMLAQTKGLPICYDKTALLATSLFKLSHFRNDVTIASYMLA